MNTFYCTPPHCSVHPHCSHNPPPTRGACLCEKYLSMADVSGDVPGASGQPEAVDSSRGLSERAPVGRRRGAAVRGGQGEPAVQDIDGGHQGEGKGGGVQDTDSMFPQPSGKMWIGLDCVVVTLNRLFYSDRILPKNKYIHIYTCTYIHLVFSIFSQP